MIASFRIGPASQFFHRTRLVFQIAVLCSLVIPTSGAETKWKIGLARTKITPEKPVVLAGYAARTKPFEKVDQDLFAKALALQDDQGHRAVLVTTDLCSMSADVAQPVFQRIVERTGLKPDEILLSFSHTHSGPIVALAPSTNVPPADAGATVAYTRRLQEQLVHVACEALARLEPGQLSWGSGIVHFVMNRREFTPRGVILGVNPRGLVDRSVPVLRVDSPEGKLRAVLMICACHGTTAPSNHLGVNGDYAGYAQAYLEEKYPGAQAMFMMGCGGDANPHPRNELGAEQQHGRALAGEVARVLETTLLPIEGPLTCAAGHAELPLQTYSRDELSALASNGPGWQTGNARQMLSAMERGETLASHYRAPVAVWQFGTNLTLVALSGEVVVGYVPLLEEALGPLRLWIAAYCNDVSGYIPTKRILEEGGYETRGLYSTTGFFKPEAQDVLVEKVRELAIQAGRRVPQAFPRPR